MTDTKALERFRFEATAEFGQDAWADEVLDENGAWVRYSDYAARIAELEAEIARLRNENDDLKPWAFLGRKVMMVWPEGDLDGGELQDAAECCGVLVPVPGGFDPGEHDDHWGCAEAADPWFQMIQFPALEGKTDE